ncbi:MAG TPA: GNAT family N-acetyltransferase [Burkholderiaceae bacterium]|jgi:ribosomal protein S18 acetylase RimI-like enzyme|nr:GNAT family N-acetyltransferase [Burkholderiaceae bacterium]
MKPITFSNDRKISAAQLADVFRRSGIRRPIDDLARIEKMLRRADILVTAWDGEHLIGVARGLSDFSYCCYLSDLAVDREYQQAGIGKTLVEMVQAAIGEQACLLLLAAPEAQGYYPKIGFEAAHNAWIIKRSH